MTSSKPLDIVAYVLFNALFGEISSIAPKGQLREATLTMEISFGAQ
jgi:hypothetical protein